MDHEGKTPTQCSGRLGLLPSIHPEALTRGPGAMKGTEELLHQWDRVEMQHLQHAVTSDVVTSAEGGVSAVLRAAVLLSGTRAGKAGSQCLCCPWLPGTAAPAWLPEGCTRYLYVKSSSGQGKEEGGHAAIPEAIPPGHRSEALSCPSPTTAGKCLPEQLKGAGRNLATLGTITLGTSRPQPCHSGSRSLTQTALQLLQRYL